MATPCLRIRNDTPFIASSKIFDMSINDEPDPDFFRDRAEDRFFPFATTNRMNVPPVELICATTMYAIPFLAWAVWYHSAAHSEAQCELAPLYTSIVVAVLLSAALCKLLKVQHKTQLRGLLASLHEERSKFEASHGNHIEDTNAFYLRELELQDQLRHEQQAHSSSIAFLEEALQRRIDDIHNHWRLRSTVEEECAALRTSLVKAKEELRASAAANARNENIWQEEKSSLCLLFAEESAAAKISADVAHQTLASRIKTLEEQLSDARNYADTAWLSLTARIRNHEECIASLTVQLGASSQENMNLKQRLLDARDEIDSSMLKVVELLDQLSGQRIENRALCHDLDSERARIKQLEIDAQKHQELSEKTMQELRIESRRCHEIITALRVDTDDLKRKNRDLEQALKDSHAGNQKSLNGAAQQKEAMLQSSRGYASRVRELQRELSEQSETLKTYQTQNLRVTELLKQNMSDEIAVTRVADMLVTDLSKDPRKRIKQQRRLMLALHPDRCPADRIANKLTQELQQSAGWLSSHGG